MQQLNDERYNVVLGNNAQFAGYHSFYQHAAKVATNERMMPNRRGTKRANAERVSLKSSILILVINS